MKNLYNKHNKKLMRIAGESSSSRSNRIENIRQFALAAGYKRIGLAHCVTFSKEAGIINEYLSNDFEVYSVDCKYGRLKSHDLLGDSRENILCNPAGQASYLNDKDMDLNISIGLCVGHDIIFNSVSDAPVTNFIVKDFLHGHDSSKAIEELVKNAG